MRIARNMADVPARSPAAPVGKTIVPLFFASLLLGLVGCSGDSSSPTDPADTPLAAAIIGAGGGTLEYEGFALTIPPGAFDAETELELYRQQTGTAFAGGEAAPVFRIEGLPAHLATALPVRLALGSAAADSLFAMIGGAGYVPSLQNTAVTWQVADCSGASGWAEFELPAAEVAPRSKSAPTPIMVTVIRGVAETLTADGRFKIYWSPAMADVARVADLKGFLEAAMVLYGAMGFVQEGFDDWPVKVIVRPLDEYGYWSPNSNSLGGHLAFSSRYLSDAVEMRLTAGHELFHFCQYFYDPRPVWERGTFAGPLVWLDEATAVYIEDYFAPDAEYCSSARGGRELTLLDGILTPGDGRTMGEHGYGLSSLIRYLAQSEGSGFILATYQGIRSGQHAVAALQGSTETDITADWREILEELIAGNIYRDVTLDVLHVATSSELMTIGGAADSVGTDLFSYPDLSGRTYFVEFSGYAFSPDQRLDFWCDSSEYGLSVFGWRGPGTLEMLGHAYGQVSLGNLPDIQGHYDSLLLLVSNQHLAGPGYDNLSDIALQGRLRRTQSAAQYDHGKILIRYEADWSNGSHVLYQDMTYGEVSGIFSDNTFSATWDSIGTNGVHYSGYLEVDLDPVDLHAVNWSARNRAEMDDGTASDFQAGGGELPLVTMTPTQLETRIEGAQTCAAITSLSAVFTGSGGGVTRSLDSYTCNSGSYVKVLLYDRSSR